MSAGLVYEEEGAFIDLMMCAMRQAAQTTPPHGRTQGKKVATHRQMHEYDFFVVFCLEQCWPLLKYK